MELSMHNLATAERGEALALLPIDDEDVVSRSPARLLITARRSKRSRISLAAFMAPDAARDARSSRHGLSNFPSARSC
jgi:hypothetical protein